MPKLSIILLLLFLTFTLNFAQPRRSGIIGTTISGKVIDNTDNKALEYANILLYKAGTEKVITGTVTNSEGTFKIENILPGSYFLGIKFIGYERSIIDSLVIGPQGRHIDIGIVRLQRAAFETDEVEVVAEQSFVEYKIDKKVINVGKQATSMSGTAIDALEISPAVQVDIDGTVSLRGSTNFTLLIDGKPSVLDPSAALEQIPASSIDNIEIITNPSAKFDPDGTSGIINVILKKNDLKGLSGLINLSGGTQENYGGDALVEYRYSGFTANFGLNYNDRNRPGTISSYRSTTTEGIETILDYEGDRDRGGTMYGVRGGISLDFTESDNISASFRFGRRDFGHGSSLNYEEWSSINPEHLFYKSNESSLMEGNYYRLNLDYTHKFPGKDHKLYLEVYHSYRNMDDLSTNNTKDLEGNLTEAREFIEGGPGKNWRFKAEYKLPFNETDYLETGYQARLDIDDEFNENYLYNLETGVFDFLDIYSHDSYSKEDIHSLFATYKAENNGFGYQLGLRGEYTYRDIELVGENQIFNIDRLDYFPTFHTSFKFDDSFQIMGSYTRRIVRPRGWYLEPFETWTDAFNVRIGNPELIPEYINSFEAGIQKHFEVFTFSAEIYYRNTLNKIERVRSVYSENVMLQTFANVGEDRSIGAEIMLTLNPVKMWNMNLTGNLYHYEQKGKLFEEDFSTDSFNYGLRMNNRLMFSQIFGIQLDIIWDSPTVSAQGKREGRFMLNTAASYQIIPRQLTAILQIRDVLGTMKREYVSSGTDFFSSTIMERKSPMVSLTLRYSINNYKRDRDRDRDNGDQNGGMEIEEEFN